MIALLNGATITLRQRSYQTPAVLTTHHSNIKSCDMLDIKHRRASLHYNCLIHAATLHPRKKKKNPQQLLAREVMQSFTFNNLSYSTKSQKKKRPSDSPCATSACVWLLPLLSAKMRETQTPIPPRSTEWSMCALVRVENGREASARGVRRATRRGRVGEGEGMSPTFRM